MGSGGLAVLAENRCAPGLHRGAELTLARVPVKVRFAPSPTGSLHLGNALSAVANRRLGEWMLLRIDDTDPARNVSGGEEAILRDLEWLGVAWDEGPVRQSDRAERQRELGAPLGERYDGVTLVREDGSPTYHLASVVDDIDFGITHVVRGNDHRPNEALHRRMFEALGATPPEFVHHGLILGPDGRKLAKRAPGGSVASLRDEGIPAEAVRAYLEELGQLPDSSLVSMVPVGLKSRGADSMAGGGGNAVGSVMVRLGTDLADPADRLASVHKSMKAGKEALGSMTPNQIVAMSALGMAPSIVIPLLRLNGIVRPPFNLIISNVPGPRSVQYLNGAKMTGTYPLSIPINGMALNITCNSYADDMGFGLTGCRRSVPHLQRLLTHLDDELGALEKATGVS